MKKAKVEAPALPVVDPSAAAKALALEGWKGETGGEEEGGSKKKKKRGGKKKAGGAAGEGGEGE